MRFSYCEILRRERCIVLLVFGWLCCATASNGTSIHEATLCHGNTLLQLGTKPTKTRTGRHHSTVYEAHGTASRPTEPGSGSMGTLTHMSPSATKRNMAIFAVIAILGICILCAMLNLRASSRRADPTNTTQAGTFGNQFGSNPGAALLAKRTDGQMRTRSAVSSSQRALALSDSATFLCPGLVVPAKSDCVLVIRILPKIADSNTDIGDAAAGKPRVSIRHFDIFDLLGKPVLSASMSQPWPKFSEDSVVSLRELGASRDAGCLTSCKPGSIDKSIDIYDKNDIVFGHMKRDPVDDCSMRANAQTQMQNPSSTGFTMNRSSGEFLLHFEGSFEEHRVTVYNHLKCVATTEPCRTKFEPAGNFYQARVAEGVDVGLVLSGLLAIDAMDV